MPDPRSRPNPDDPTLLSLTEAAAQLRSGSLSCLDYAQALLERCSAATELNALAALEPELVLAAARRADRTSAAGRPLHGIAVVVKDNIHTGTLPATAGTGALAGNQPDQPAEAVQKLLDAGAIVLATSTMHELAAGWTGNNAHHGPTRNPYRPDRIAGGSSGGSACAVAAHLAPAALGTDTNGSVRVPAALCGVVGLRPSTGRYSTDGVVPLSSSLDTVGTFARSAADLALLDSVLTGGPLPSPRSTLAGVRIGLLPGYFDDLLDREVAGGFDRAATMLAGCGAELVTVDFPELRQLVSGITSGLIQYESVADLVEYLARYAPGITMDALRAGTGPDLAEAYPVPTEAGRQAYRLSRDRQQQAVEAIDRLFVSERLELILHAPLAMPAPPVADQLVSPAPPVLIDGQPVPGRVAFGRNVTFGTVGGLPGLVLPVGWTQDGLPLAIELNGRRGQDQALLGLGIAVEHALSAG